MQITRALNITVIYVTHDQGEALTMSDRIAVMNQGKIEQLGTAREIYETPANYFVADFIGESNFIAGEISEIKDRICTFNGEGGLLFKSIINSDELKKRAGHLSIRPEKISIVEEGQSFPNMLQVVVEEAVYLGDSINLKTKIVESGLELAIKQQNKDVSKPFLKGDKFSVGWKEKDSCIL
jgi:ABC-type Fe3+/spermidine/putrescine transport system ATPase subunit